MPYKKCKLAELKKKQKKLPACFAKHGPVFQTFKSMWEQEEKKTRTKIHHGSDCVCTKTIFCTSQIPTVNSHL